MADCKTCKGTGLKPLLRPGTEKLLFMEDECPSCGGKGWDDKGATHYKVAVFLNSARVLGVSVLARNAVEAMRKASEMVQTSMAGGLKRGDVLGLEVHEE